MYACLRSEYASNAHTPAIRPILFPTRTLALYRSNPSPSMRGAVRLRQKSPSLKCGQLLQASALEPVWKGFPRMEMFLPHLPHHRPARLLGHTEASLLMLHTLPNVDRTWGMTMMSHHPNPWRTINAISRGAKRQAFIQFPPPRRSPGTSNGPDLVTILA